MYLPKSDIYAALNTLGVPVRQSSQKVASEVPAITFHVGDNNTELTMDKNIRRQDILITIDIWAKTGPAADSLLAQVETKMRAMGYRLAFTLDVPDPDNIAHINTRFETVK